MLPSLSNLGALGLAEKVRDFTGRNSALTRGFGRLGSHRLGGDPTLVLAVHALDIINPSFPQRPADVDEVLLLQYSFQDY